MNEHDEFIVLQNVTSHGTENRYLALNPPHPGNEVAGDLGNVVEYMRFLKSVIKDLHVHKHAVVSPPSPRVKQ